ncbi:DUF4145 domain-containing protein [Nostoc sp. FACHB-973]|nr:DUF4145 domain-containing protein [Nostoc sp. FACHB-973]
MSEQANQSTKNTVRCGHCGNKTLMQIIAEGKYSKTLVCDPVNAYEAWRDYHIKNLLCPNCNKLNVIEFTSNWDIYSIQELNHHDDQTDLVDTKIVYLYPSIKEFADQSPKAQDIRYTYREASTCFQAELYTSSVVMCRKTMEMLCLYFDIKQPYTLDGKLSEMRNQGIIDNKLYEWANILKYFGNEAVHSSTKFSKEDTQDILDFTYALVEYCIDFDYKFSELLQRRDKAKLSQNKETNLLGEATINALTEALNAKEASVRYYAAIILAQRNLEFEQVIPVLLSLTDKTKFSSNAINCLKSIGLKAIPELINAIETPKINSNIRSAAAAILGDIGANNPDVMISLVKALKDKNDDVQYKAAIALEKLGFTAVSTFAKMHNI